MPGPYRHERLEKAADILRVVAHPVRLGILQVLEDGEKNVTEICQALGAAQAYTSQQLNLLKARGVLASRKDGSQVFYRIAFPAVLKIIQCVCAQEEGSEPSTGAPVDEKDRHSPQDKEDPSHGRRSTEQP
ncbi:ArsR/SmtB family transcription factor [Desulfosoma sp.]